MTNVADETVAPYAASSVRFRKATTSDRSALLALCAGYRRADAQAQAPQLVTAALDAALSGDALVHVYIIELLEESAQRGEGATMLVGYLALTLGFSIESGGREAFVDELYVEPPVQGRGLGSQALRFAEVLCHELGVRRLRLEVERENIRAKKLYSALGYREHGRHLLSKLLG